MKMLSRMNLPYSSVCPDEFCAAFSLTGFCDDYR